MTFFVKRYLYTTDEEHHNRYKYEVLRYSNAYTYHDLNLSFSEMMGLPIFLMEEMYATYKQNADQKKNNIKHHTK